MILQWVRWHPRGHIVLAGSDDTTVWMWNADKSAYLNSFSGHSSSVTCGDFTPDGMVIMFLFFLNLFTFIILTVSFYNLGKTICTGSDDASLRIWNPKTGENIHVVKGMYYSIY